MHDNRMLTETLNIDKGQWLSNVLPLIPANTIFDKTITGCGATTLEINAARNSIVIEPNIPVILGKKAEHPFLFAVYEGIAKEDVKAYLRELHELQKEDVPQELVVIAMEGVDSLNIADHIRELYPRTGLIWSCDLDFALQAFHHQADYFFFLNEASRETLGTGLTRWQYRVEQHKDRGNEQ